MAQAFIGIGSNIDPVVNIRRAIGLLAFSVVIKAVSTVYRTPAEKPVMAASDEAVGMDDEERHSQPDYLNCVLEVMTGNEPLRLKYHVLRHIEEVLGRERYHDRYAPRVIDIDLLLYGDMVVDSPDLTLPDPDIFTRPFLAAGLHEIAPSLILPGSHIPIAEVSCPPASHSLEPLHALTRSLRRSLWQQ